MQLSKRDGGDAWLVRSKSLTGSEILSSASVRVRARAAQATLIFLTAGCYSELFNKPLKVKYSLSDDVFCVNTDRTPITPDQLPQLESAVRNVIANQKDLTEVNIPRDELYAIFKANGQADKIGVLKSFGDAQVKCVRCGSFLDYVLEPMQTDLKEVTVFAYQPYLDGFILRFPTLLSPTAVPEWSDDPEQLDMIREYGEWAEIVGVDNVAKLNHMIFRRQLNDLKWPGEGLHQRKITKIAQALVKNFATQRIITISGPSSSNKTTFAKRLGIALRVKGHRSLIIEMDDFFVNAADTPLGADGKKDFEAFTAVNLPLLQERVEKLLKGESVPRRKYQFKKGQGIDIESERLTLHPDMFLILEGIHGLNPILLDHLGRDRVAPIYVAALAPLAIDDTHRFPSSDLRLLRRITRDFAYRGRSARKTLLLWTSVRIGEERNIRPYRGNALYFFNSSLVYEVPVLSVCVRSLLAEATVPEPDEDLNDPITIEITREARRLLALIKPFYAISLEEVPHISCIREFCGGSDLDY